MQLIKPVWWSRLPRPISQVIRGWACVRNDCSWWHDSVVNSSSGPTLHPMTGTHITSLSYDRPPWAWCNELIALAKRDTETKRRLAWVKHPEDDRFCLRLLPEERAGPG